MKFSTLLLYSVKKLFLIFTSICVVITHDPCCCVSLSSLVFADSSPSHSSLTSHSHSPAFPEDDDEFSDFMQGPADSSFSSSFPSSSLPPSSPSLRAAHTGKPLETGSGPHPSSSPVPPSFPPSLPVPPSIQHSSVISSSQTAFQGNSSIALFFYHTSLVVAVTKGNVLGWLVLSWSLMVEAVTTSLWTKNIFLHCLHF